MPNSFAVLALTVFSVFTGHVIQALVSIVEPLLHKSWGSRPSDRAMTDGLGERYFPMDSAERISAKLKTVAGKATTHRSLFLYAMTLAEGDKKSRAASFNASYAYHRALLMLAIATVIITLVSAKFGALRTFSRGQMSLLVLALLAVTVLLWYRCKQRAFYYAREVLLTAERLIDSRSTSEIEK